MLKRLLFLSLTILAHSEEIYNEDTETCEVDSDCPSLHFCNETFFCEHKALFPMTKREIWGMGFLGIVIGIANGGGIGGG
jgi:hypothetical protein